MRADAQRNVEGLLGAAKTVFASHGVDAPAKQIADLAGVGVGTLYRHFPQRSDLVVAVFQREVDATAAAAGPLSDAHAPVDALRLWLERYTQYVATKHGLANALHSGDPAFNALPGYFQQHLGPVLEGLLARASDAGEVRGDVDPMELLGAVANLCWAPPGIDNEARAQRMVALLVDGLRFGATRAL